MSRFLKAPIFYVSVLLAALYFLGAIDITKALNSPSGNPPTGGAILSADSPPANTLYFASSGFVGIGTTTPSQQLTISSSSDNLFGLSRIGATYPVIFKMNTSGDFTINVENEDIFTLQSGRVGIGTTNPTGVLSVSGGGIAIDNVSQGGKKHNRIPINNTLTAVDSNTGIGVGARSSITIGQDGLPVISYLDAINNDLKVAKCGNIACSSGNILTTIDSVGVVGLYPSIIIGADGFPVISYYDSTHSDLLVAHCGNADCSSGNTTTTVDSSGSVGSDTSISIGSDGFPVVSYFDGTNGDLKVAKCGNADCSSGNTITTADSGLSSVTDGPNNPATSTNDNSTGTIAWTNFSNVLASDDSYANIQPQTNGNEGPIDPSIGTSNSSIGTLAWFSPENIYSSDNVYATSTRFDFGTTTEYLTATGFNFSIPSSATIDGIVVEFERFRSSGGGTLVDNAVRIIKGGFIGTVDKSSSTAWTTNEAYYSYGGSSDLWGETWAPSDINASNFGAALSVTCTSGCASRIVSVDHVRITVYYTEGSVSNYVTATNFGFSVPSGATINGIKAEIERKQNGGTLVDNAVRIIKGGAIGTSEHASTTAWSGTEAYYSYGGASDLWGDTWTYSDINSSNFGVALSVKCTSDCGSASGDVDHIKITVYYTIAGSVGTFNSIIVAPDGLPVISYLDSTNSNLVVTKCGNAACSSGNNTTIVDATIGGTETDTSITIGDDGLPLVSYLHSLSGNLRILHCGNKYCSSGNATTSIENIGGAASADTSITIGPDGLPIVSYYYQYDSSLKSLKCGNISCSSGNSTVTIDSAGTVGGGSSATIGVDGLPIISYYDTTNGDLKVARCGSENCLPYWTRR